jgi:hypothetical protein
MIDPKQIPKEVVEAAARAMWRTDDPSQWEKGMAIVALTAAMNAWEGAIPTSATDHLLVARPALVLPLPKEGADD